MKIEKSTVKGWELLTISEKISLETQMGPVEEAIKEAASGKVRHVAVAFARDSYLCSRSIATLMKSNAYLNNKGGALAIVDPSEDLSDLFDTLGVSNLVIMVTSLENLPNAVDL